jgi:hypothetical protein
LIQYLEVARAAERARIASEASMAFDVAALEHPPPQPEEPRFGKTLENSKEFFAVKIRLSAFEYGNKTTACNIFI